MAAPHVAGIVALILDANPNLTDNDIRNILASTTNENPTTSSFINTPSIQNSILEESFNITGDTELVNPPEENDPLSLLTTQIVRFRSEQVAGTYLFASEQESRSIRRNFSDSFTEEGDAFKVATEDNGNDNLIRFNRFQNNNVQGTYLFASEQESRNIRRNFSDAFTEEGVAFYALGADSEVGTEYYRLRNRNLSGTYIFVNETEKNQILNTLPQFVNEGIAFKVA